jgi:hypothetical protein
LARGQGGHICRGLTCGKKAYPGNLYTLR